MLTKLVYFRPTTIAYVRTNGQCERAIADAWATVDTTISAPEFSDTVDRAFGLRWCKECGVAQNLSYEAGIVYSDSVDISGRSPFSMRTLPGGSYLRKKLTCKPETPLRHLDEIMSELCDNDNFMLDTRRPTIEVLKLRVASNLDSAHVEICIPVVPRFDQETAH